ncbi:MAG: hypothetical protein ABSC90_02815 [Acidimicrobiales bacterium]
MQYPTDDEVRSMSNRELVTLMRAQAESIERSLGGDNQPVFNLELPGDGGP